MDLVESIGDGGVEIGQSKILLLLLLLLFGILVLLVLWFFWFLEKKFFEYLNSFSKRDGGWCYIPFLHFAENDEIVIHEENHRLKPLNFLTFWKSEIRCLIVISHRWERPEHPDPRNLKIKIIKKMVDDGWKKWKRWGVEEGGSWFEERKDACMGRMTLEEWAQACNNEMDFKKGIGIWIDYCCISQRNEEKKKEGLKNLDRIIGLSTMVIVDTHQCGVSGDYYTPCEKNSGNCQDHFKARAWTVAELGVAVGHAVGLVFPKQGHKNLHEKSFGITFPVLSVELKKSFSDVLNVTLNNLERTFCTSGKDTVRIVDLLMRSFSLNYPTIYLLFGTTVIYLFLIFLDIMLLVFQWQSEYDGVLSSLVVLLIADNFLSLFLLCKGLEFLYQIALIFCAVSVFLYVVAHQIGFYQSLDYFNLVLFCFFCIYWFLQFCVACFLLKKTPYSLSRFTLASLVSKPFFSFFDPVVYIGWWWLFLAPASMSLVWGVGFLRFSSPVSASIAVLIAFLYFGFAFVLYFKISPPPDVNGIKEKMRKNSSKLDEVIVVLFPPISGTQFVVEKCTLTDETQKLFKKYGYLSLSFIKDGESSDVISSNALNKEEEHKKTRESCVPLCNLGCGEPVPVQTRVFNKQGYDLDSGVTNQIKYVSLKKDDKWLETLKEKKYLEEEKENIDQKTAALFAVLTSEPELHTDKEVVMTRDVSVGSLSLYCFSSKKFTMAGVISFSSSSSSLSSSSSSSWSSSPSAKMINFSELRAQIKVGEETRKTKPQKLNENTTLWGTYFTFEHEGLEPDLEVKLYWGKELIATQKFEFCLGVRRPRIKLNRPEIKLSEGEEKGKKEEKKKEKEEEKEEEEEEGEEEEGEECNLIK